MYTKLSALSSIVVLVLFMFVITSNQTVYAEVQEGLYFNTTKPVYASMTDIIEDTDRVMTYIDQTELKSIYYISNGKMATIQEMVDAEDWENAFYPIDLAKLKPVYTRLIDGSTIEIDQSLDMEPPEVEYIR
ncbi:hypothetical protein [Brevibacillus sp. SYSU BS000544]|uniref:hypothetical protein n=1 Tax=Brevibacillus sp. SYSU BS000544 TaxID=3416443 RepID=UPI003CE57C76